MGLILFTAQQCFGMRRAHAFSPTVRIVDLQQFAIHRLDQGVAEGQSEGAKFDSKIYNGI